MSLSTKSLVTRAGRYLGPVGLSAAIAVGAVALINQGLVPTTQLLGETFPLERFEDAFSLLTRQTPGRDAVRVALRLA